jgi:hypothetical protein
MNAGCSRPSGPSEPSSGAGAAQPASSAGPTPSASESPRAAPDPQADAARAFVASWSHALDAHDVARLEKLYAPVVCFYGKVVPRSDVMHAKRAALGARSTFHQTIAGAVEVQRQPDGGVAAIFLKRSGPVDHLRDVAARLVLRSRPGPSGAYDVVEEADATDSPAAAKPDGCASEAWKQSEAADAEDRCEEAVQGVVNELPGVKRFLEEAHRYEGPERSLGGMGPQEDGDELLYSMGFHTAERYEMHVFYSVDRRTGVLTVMVDGGDEAVPPAARKVVADACRR